MPFISGKDSLHNEYRSQGRHIAIPGTLLISALGLVPGDPTSTNAVRFQDSQTNNLSVGTPGETFGAGGGPLGNVGPHTIRVIDSLTRSDTRAQGVPAGMTVTNWMPAPPPQSPWAELPP